MLIDCYLLRYEIQKLKEKLESNSAIIEHVSGLIYHHISSGN